jgi:hypothetical protein
MCLLEFIDDWSNQWRELCWGDVPDPGPGSANQSIPYRLHLERLRRTILDLSNRIARKEEQTQFLTERVQIFMRVGDQANAWALALEIDRQREFITAEKRELAQARKDYHQTLRDLRRVHAATENRGPGLATC